VDWYNGLQPPLEAGGDSPGGGGGACWGNSGGAARFRGGTSTTGLVRRVVRPLVPEIRIRVSPDAKDGRMPEPEPEPEPETEM
jgi:hypothetical protein